MPGSSTLEPDQQKMARLIAYGLWAFSALLLVLFAIKAITSGSVSSFGTGTVALLLLTLSAFGRYQYRQSSSIWSINQEALTSSLTFLPPILLTLFLVPADSNLVYGVVFAGIMTVGSSFVFLAGKDEATTENIHSTTSSTLNSTLAEPATSIEAPPTQQQTNPPAQPEAEQGAEQKTEANSITVTNALDDTQIMDIPVLGSNIDLENVAPVETEKPALKPTELHDSPCTETDRSYDLFGEESKWVTQQFRRTKRPTGCEAFEGYMKIEWQSGQKTTVFHVPFSPPFTTSPEVYCEPADESDVRMKVAECRSYGARVEIRLSRPALEGQTTCVHFLACSQQNEEELSDSPEDEIRLSSLEDGQQDVA